MEMEKTVGQAKVEEEPEGEVIVGPSGEEVKPSSSGYTPPFFSKADPLDQTSAYQIFQPDSLCSFGIVSCADESSQGEEARVKMKEEYEVDQAWSWVEVGVCQHWQRRRHRGC